MNLRQRLREISKIINLILICIVNEWVSKGMDDKATNSATNNHNQDYYKVLEVDYDATDENIRFNYRRLALKWHPDKHKGDTSATAKFQEINEAYKVLIDPAKRFDYDFTGIYEIDKYTLREYLARFKGMILTCNGLGISNTSSIGTEQLKGSNNNNLEEK